MIHSIETTIKPRVGRPVGLGRGHIDPTTLALTLHYQELVDKAGIWEPQLRQQALVEGTHFSLDAAAGSVTLLDNALWDTLGLWRAADREESLLYKGQVKEPQYITATFDHYVPEQVQVMTDKAVIIGDGSDPLTISVVAEAGTDPVPVAVYQGDEKVGSIPVSSGQRTITSNHAGTYRLEADRDVLDPTWGLPVFAQAVEYGSATVEVTSA